MFPNGLECPGDHRGAPEEVYNCRCTMRAVFPQFESGQNQRTTNTVQTYEEWKNAKEFKMSDNDGDDSLVDFLHEKPFTPGDNVSKIKASVKGSNGFYYSRYAGVNNADIEYIEENILSAINLVDPEGKYKQPTIVVCGKLDLVKRNGTKRNGHYDQYTNTLYVSSDTFFDVKKYNNWLMPNDSRKTTVHELYHWLNAQKFSEKNGPITPRNIDIYKWYKNEIGYNVFSDHREIDIYKLSWYASVCMDKKNYNEIGTEIMTYLAICGGK